MSYMSTTDCISLLEPIGLLLLSRTDTPLIYHLGVDPLPTARYRVPCMHLQSLALYHSGHTEQLGR